MSSLEYLVCMVLGAEAPAGEEQGHWRGFGEPETVGTRGGALQCHTAALETSSVGFETDASQWCELWQIVYPPGSQFPHGTLGIHFSIAC